MNRLALAAALALLPAAASAVTLPVYRDPLGAPGILSSFDLAPGGPIVRVFDTTVDDAATSLLLEASRGDAASSYAQDPIRLATACQIAGCTGEDAYELARPPAPIADEPRCVALGELPCAPAEDLR